MKHKNSWSIVASVSEPWPLIISFVAHHLSRGASRIYLFLDNPDTDVERILKGHPKVEILVGTEENWRLHFGIERPKRFMDRQHLNANFAYQKCTSDWLAHIDADEFLMFKRPIFKVLGRVPDDINFVKLRVAEAVGMSGHPAKTIFGSLFRQPLFGKPNLVDEVYGETTQYLNKGITGHSIGKSFFRTGRDLSVGVHDTGRGPDTMVQPVAKKEVDPKETVKFAPRHNLLHFDGLTAHHFMSKLVMIEISQNIRFKRGPFRYLQVHYANKHQDQPEVMDAFYRQLKELSDAQYQKLLAAKSVVSIDLDIETSLKAQFPDLKVDLSPAYFDRLLKLKGA